MYRKLTVGLALLAFAGSGAIAGSGGDDRIARLSYLEGHVSFQHAGEVDWNAASVNLALQAADRIYTGSDGRAEVQFDEGSVLRLAENTDVEILALRETLIQIRILVGLASLSSRGTVPFEVGTPAAVFTTTDDGAYRFDVTETAMRS
jgi:ferric-dicitrate binding protein FerR (iron transport regulator)